MASSVSKWLKKEQIYDADIEKVLVEQGVNDPAKDFKTYTQKQYDELYRKSVVERAKDLKDQKAKLRLEKKMTKIEKYWRKESGVKSSSIKKSQKNAKKGQSTTNKSKSANANALKQANELKKYLQKNDCFDKDLLVILCEMDIKKEDDLNKIDTNSKYDEIYRQIRVLRAKELKDNQARIRMEKLMTKFEKLWRKKTGIKKKSSQSEKTKNKKAKKDPKSTANDELDGKGKELKNWMKKNKVWEKALYDSLMANNISSPQQLSELSEKQFDGIVRKVRVDRFSQLKDQKSRNRADKLLISFEKAWRKASGIKKTSIKNGKKAAGGGNDDNKEASGDGSGGGKEEVMPWYLSGKQKNKKNSALASNPRTAHQKKKDNKINNKLRESDKIELEWIEIYSRAKYGDFIAPPTEDKYAKKKDKKKEEEQATDENKDEKEDDGNKTPNLFEIVVDFEEIVVDVCIEMLLTLHESWEGRVSILNALINQLCDENCNDDIYALKMCKFLAAIGHQFTDPRSLIIQAMEECMTRLAKSTPDRFIIFAPFIMESLFVTFPVRIEALREPGIKLGKTLISTMIEYDTKYVLLRTIFNGLNSKQAAIRTECADYVDLMIRNIPVLEKGEDEEVSEEEKQLLTDIDTAVKKACKDAASEARMNGYRALTQFKKIAPNAAQEIIDKMTKAQATKYEEANANPHYE